MTHERRYHKRGKALLWLTCETCRKRGYSRKADAKTVASRLEGRVNVYRCPATEGPVYHVGHLPEAVRVGKQDRAELRPKGLR